MVRRKLSLVVLYWLRLWTRVKLNRVKPIVIGVTGSAGKSSCVFAIETILKSKYLVKSTGTTNSESGLPLSILDLKTDFSPLSWLKALCLAPIMALKANSYQLLICEMGIDELVWPKNMDYLLSIVQPKIGVLLNVLPVHTLQMGNVENIFKEKSKLIVSLPKDGTAVINPKLPEIKTAARVIKFSPAVIKSDKYFFIDESYETFGAAIAVGEALGIPAAISCKLLAKSYTLPPGRGRIFTGINGSKIIDSSYNSSPIPTASFLKTLKKASGKRKIAVLGDMRELGNLAEIEHKKLAKIASGCADIVITVGPLWKRFAKFETQFDNFSQAGEMLQTFLKPGDLVLFKGSQNTIFLEGAVEMCLADKSDVQHLCRRGKFWDRQRKLIFNSQEF